MLETIQALNLIATNPNVRGGRPYIIGTTVTVSDIIIRLYHNQDADGIASWYNLTLPQVLPLSPIIINIKRTLIGKYAAKYNERRKHSPYAT